MRTLVSRLTFVLGGVGLFAYGLESGEAVAQLGQQAVGCEVSDFSVALRLYMPLAGDGSGSPGPKGLEGTLEIRHQKVPKDLRLWSLDGKRPAQFWNRDNEMKMLLLLGSGEGQIKLIIETARRQDSGEHRGTFRLESQDVKVQGRLACAVG